MPDLSTGLPTEFTFTKDGQFLDDQVSAVIEVSASEAAAAFLKADEPFPNGTRRVGSLSVNVHGNPGAIKFGGAQGTVTFSAQGSSSIGVYDNIADLLKDLAPDSDKEALQGLTIDAPGATQFVLLDWGYDIAGSGKGSIALGAGATATFAADGATDGLFAVIRGFATPPKSREALQSTINSWMLPRQVTSVEDLEPGTWLIAEVDGSIGIKIGAQFGYDFNWIRKVNLGNLSGDVGLKIQSAVDAAVGFNASGKYLVLVARESLDPTSKVVRVQIFKMAKKGWSFAFDANVGVTGSTGALLPSQVDDFVAAVFGVYGAQVVEDLKEFGKWTDPTTTTPEELSGFVSDFVTKEFNSIGGDTIHKYEEARKRIADFLQQWESLGNTTSTMLWSAIQKAGGPVTALLNFLKKTNGLDDSALKALIESELAKAGFSSNPVGQWLESVAGSDVLSLLNSSPLLGKVRNAAHNVLAIADGKVLGSLVTFVDQKLNISDVEKVVHEADFNNLDPWLKDKLAKVLGKQKVLFSDLSQIRATVKTIQDKASELYQQAVKALNAKYTFAFDYTYSKTTMSTALVDVSFDFTQNPAVGAFLKAAIQGDFKDLLVATSPGVALKSAALTHGVTRQSHIQIALPYFSDTIDHINEALAGMTIVEDNGRLFVYSVQAKDSEIRAHKWVSSLTLTGKMTAVAGVRTFVTDAEVVAKSMTFAYRFRQAAKEMRDVQLEDQLQPFISPYFPKAFGGSTAPQAASLHEWIGDLDNQASKINRTRTGNLGNVLLSLDVSLPGEVVAAWLNAPADPKADAYFEMSRNIQRVLRRFTQYCYFGDLAHYADIDTAPAVFVYGCLPVSTNIRLNDNDAIDLDLNDSTYWDYESERERQAMVYSKLTKTALAARMAGIQRVLQDSARFKSSAQYYDPTSLDRPLALYNVREAALHNQAFWGLLYTEAQTIDHAAKAAVNLTKYRKTAGTDPEEAMQALQDFGEKITEAFNNGLGRLIHNLPEFSAMIFLEAARAFDPGLLTVKAVARLDTILLRSSAPQSVIDAFLNGTAPDATTVAVEQPIMGLP